MSELDFIDTNVLVHHVIGDDPAFSALATAYIGRLERSEVRARLSETVVFDAVYTLQKQFGVPRVDIRDALLPIILLPAIVLPGKSIYTTVFALYLALPALSFADCYHVALMRRLKLKRLVSFDRGFDRIPDITRIEPS